MNKQDKVREAQIQLDVKEQYRPLTEPMVKETYAKVLKLIDEHYQVDERTKKWLCQAINPPRIPIFYTLTKVHKPTPVGRPIISGCDGLTKKLSSFVDTLLQPIATSQKSDLKDTTDFINFLEEKKFPEETILVSMDVTSFYSNIPQEEVIKTICVAYDNFYKNNSPIPRQLLVEAALRLILQENSFQFNKKNYLQTHGTTMGTKMAVAFANILIQK